MPRGDFIPPPLALANAIPLSGPRLRPSPQHAEVARNGKVTIRGRGGDDTTFVAGGHISSMEPRRAWRRLIRA